MSARRVAGEVTAVNHPPDLTARQIQHANPRAIDRGAKRREHDIAIPGQCVGPPVTQLSCRAIRSSQPLRCSAAVRRDPEQSLGVSRREHDRVVAKPCGSADAKLLAKAKRAATLARDFHDPARRSEADPSAVRREEHRVAAFGSGDRHCFCSAQFAPEQQLFAVHPRREDKSSAVRREPENAVRAGEQFLSLGEHD